ncbi:MAG: methyltransferase regulatory domain-containing protein [Burkholderiaceae bacterium]|nr:methyltransferase regulatory domain-containing protein [Burkholderiaceae bacterium]
MPEHCLVARQMAASGGIENVQWAELGFGEYLNEDLPQFDYIVMHGVYSWVSDEVKAQIRNFLSRKLRPGGTVYLSYNSQPGWSQAAPLQTLLSIGAREAGVAGNSVNARFGSALTFAERLADAGANYFKTNPEAVEKLRSMKTEDQRYLVHEYLNEQWKPLYFSDVASELNPCKLNFAAYGDPSEHYDALCLNASGLALIESVDDPILRQTLRDYLMNTAFRKDYFLKGGRKLTPFEQRRLLLQTPFALCVPTKHVVAEFVARIGRVALNPEFVSSITGLLEAGPQTLASLMELTKTKAQNFTALLQLIVALVTLGAIHPCPVKPRESAAARRLSISQWLVRHLKAENGPISPRH